MVRKWRGLPPQPRRFPHHFLTPYFFSNESKWYSHSRGENLQNKKIKFKWGGVRGVGENGEKVRKWQGNLS